MKKGIIWLCVVVLAAPAGWAAYSHHRIMSCYDDRIDNPIRPIDRVAKLKRDKASIQSSGVLWITDEVPHPMSPNLNLVRFTSTGPIHGHTTCR